MRRLRLRRRRPRRRSRRSNLAGEDFGLSSSQSRTQDRADDVRTDCTYVVAKSLRSYVLLATDEAAAFVLTAVTDLKGGEEEGNTAGEDGGESRTHTGT